MIDWIDAFLARTKTDATLKSLTKQKANGHAGIYFGFAPTELLQERLPIVTFYRENGTPVRGTYGDAVLRVQPWVWPTGASGGDARLTAIDARILALFDEQEWYHGGTLARGVAGRMFDIPSGPADPLSLVRVLYLYQKTPVTV